MLVSSNLAGVTTAASGHSGAPALSADGRWIAFFSNASDLVAGDPNGAAGDVFLRDHESGVVTRISNHPGWHGRLAGSAQPPKLTPDGSFVLYQAPGSGLFLYERASGRNRFLTDDVTADTPSMSPDGRFVVFSSRTVPGLIGGTDAHRQIYLFDRELASFELISVRDAALPRLTANDGSRFEVGVLATADDLLLIRGYATDLGPRADERKLRLWNLNLPALPLEVDLGTLAGAPVEGAKVVNLTASADGRWLAFDYDEPALAEAQGNRGWHVVLHDRRTGLNRVLNQTAGLYQGPQFPAIAPGGSQVVWRSSTSGLEQHDLATGATSTLIATSTGFAPEEAPLFTADGRRMLFRFRAGTLPEISPDPIGDWRLIELDLATGGLRQLDDLPLETASVGAVANVRLSRAGGHVTYDVVAPTKSEVWLHHLTADANIRIATNGAGALVDDAGTRIAFEADAPVPGIPDRTVRAVLLKHLPADETVLVSVNHAGTGAGHGRSRLLDLSPDGRFVLFHSWADDLVAPDDNALGDLFLRDLRTQTTLLLSVGPQRAADGHTSARARFNRAGNQIVFESYARNLTAGDFNETRDVFTATLALPDADGDGLPDSWELTWFGTLDRDGSGDADGDGVSDRDEFLAGTSPINDTSVLAALPIQSGAGGEPVILWAAVPGRTYRVQYKDDFNEPGWLHLPGEVVADSSTGRKLDETGVVGPQRFYRVLILP